MSQTISPSELKPTNRRGRTSGRSGARRDNLALSPVAAMLSEPDARTGLAAHSELERLYLSLPTVTPETHPRTARLLAASTRKAAQKVIEEAGEVALEAVKHRPCGIVRESADLLYHLVALWYRAGIDPGCVWVEMRHRAEELGIAEKPLKARHRDSGLAAPPPERSGGHHDEGK